MSGEEVEEIVEAQDLLIRPNPIGPVRFPASFKDILMDP